MTVVGVAAHPSLRPGEPVPDGPGRWQRPPDDPTTFAVVTVRWSSADVPQPVASAVPLHEAVEAVLVAVGGIADRVVDPEQGCSCWVLSPPRAAELADLIVAAAERLDPGHWTVDRR